MALDVRLSDFAKRVAAEFKKQMVASAVAITGGTIKGISSFGHGTATPAAPFHIAGTGDVLFGGATKNSAGAFYYTNPLNNYAWFGIWDQNNGKFYGISQSLPAPAGTVTLGGYYRGLGIGGSSSGTGNPMFGVLSSTQSGNGKGSVAFTILDNNVVWTYRNTLDDGNGNVEIGGTLKVTGAATFAAPLKLASYTVGTLPAGSNGAMAYATNGLKPGEAAGSGTGVAVVFSNSSWRRLSDESAVAA